MTRAVDRPVFWWSAGGIFLANACLSAAEGLWVLAVLQALTALWAAVAGVTARVTSADAPRTGLPPASGEPRDHPSQART